MVTILTSSEPTLIARFMRPTWGPSGADRTQVGPILAPWTLLSVNAISSYWGHITVLYWCILFCVTHVTTLFLSVQPLSLSISFNTLRARQNGHYFDIFWTNPDSKVHEANMGPIWGRQDPGGPHIGPMKFAIWECYPELLKLVCVTRPQWVNVAYSLPYIF